MPQKVVNAVLDRGLRRLEERLGQVFAKRHIAVVVDTFQIARDLAMANAESGGGELDGDLR